MKALIVLNHIAASLAVLEDDLTTLSRVPIFPEQGAPPAGATILRRDLSRPQNVQAQESWRSAMEALEELKHHKTALRHFFAQRK